jgi:transposase InsO family protein/transposase-like protein
MKERLKLISLYETGKYTVSELAKELRISRKTAHKWLRRFADKGVAGLDDESRAPHRVPRVTSAEVVAALIKAKQEQPTWGPAKLMPPSDATREVIKAWPAVSTRGRILGLLGLVSRRKHRRRTSPWFQPFIGADHPNNVWCADFKGWTRTGDGTRCDPLTVTDAYSRMLLCCEIVKPDYAHVRPVFERVFREFGLPLAIRTDNGTPFASIGAGGLSPLSAWWIKLGINPERIQPGHPEQNGRHERMHRTLKQETMKPPAATPQAQQERFDHFCTTYNQYRPHEALGQAIPASFYRNSPRPYLKNPGDIVYPPLTLVRRVRSNGQIRWHGQLIYISESLIGELVGITEESESWLVSFGPVPLGRIPFTPIPYKLLPLTNHIHLNRRKCNLCV